MAKILIVDDELSIIEVLKTVLIRENHEVKTTENALEALTFLREEKFDLMISDIRMKPMDGLELLEKARDLQSQLTVIMMTAYATIETAVEAMKTGAFDYICKPFKLDELKLTVNRALSYHTVLHENEVLKNTLRTKYHFENLVGDSEQMQSVYEMVEKVARTDETVLIVGASGTGKELIAKALHFASRRVDNIFIPINCGALPESLLESELFGYVKGAFTGANTNKKGLFESANEGTIFLDEISSMPLSMQMKLLRVLQDRKVRKVGDTVDIPINVRIIAATNVPLEDKIQDKTFREDLYYRLSVIPIDLPSLKQRKGDVPLLINHFLKKYNKKNKSEVEIQKNVIDSFSNYNWPGNVRELENMVNRSATLCEDEKITVKDLPSQIKPVTTSCNGSLKKDEDFLGGSLKNYLKLKEQEYIKRVLEMTNGDKEKAAEMLGISLASFYRKYVDNV